MLEAFADYMTMQTNLLGQSFKAHHMKEILLLRHLAHLLENAAMPTPEDWLEILREQELFETVYHMELSAVTL